MTVYGGFDPGTFQAWALNLFPSVFVTAGIARGFQVGPTSPAGMSVQVTLDATANDAVLYLSNGCWMRLDAVTQFSITPNSTGSTRTDALVAQVDPNNSSNLKLSVQANWASGFTPGTNQFVVALISVASGASTITSGNITMNSSSAKISGTSNSASNSLVASDGVGLTVQDNSTSSVLSLALTGLSTGVGRSIVIQTTDASSIGHLFTFGTDSSLKVPGQLTAHGVLAYPDAPTGTDDSVVLYDRNNTLGALFGVTQSGGGAYLYDSFHNGYIFQSGTNTGVTFPGSVTANTFNGPALIDVESGQTVIRPQPTSDNLVIQVNGYNTNFNNDGTVHVPGKLYLYNGTSWAIQAIGSGAGAGASIWEGPTDPGAGAGEGDIWVAG